MYWSDSGEMVCLTTDDSFYILHYFPDAARQAFANNEGVDDDGVEAAFDVSMYSMYSLADQTCNITCLMTIDKILCFEFYFSCSLIEIKCLSLV